MLEKNALQAVRQLPLLAVGAGLLALAGCASEPYEGKYAWSDGWRKGEVVAVQTSAEMKRPRFHACVRPPPPNS